MILSLLAFLVVLGILVLVHEFGHFIVAKKLGIKVLEFAFGFPPRLYSKKYGETNYSINAIPFGGYVKMLGELEHSKDKRAFENQSPGKRLLVAVAGVVMNILLAWVILSVGFTVGMPPLVSSADVIPGQKLSSEIVVAEVQKGSPAEKADLKQGDVLLRAKSGEDATDFDEAEDVGAFTKSHPGREIAIVYQRGDEQVEKKIQLQSEGETPLGVAVVERSIVQVPWYRAPYVALRETWEVTKVAFQLLGQFFVNLFSSGKMDENVGGPVAIYVYSGLAVRAGIMIFLQFIAMLSINLALINILPFPALDGGRILFVVLEKILGRKVVKEEVENIIHTIGFALLIALLIAITYRDIVKLF
ncbi:MAG: putative zinc metalloprotease [bacterium ADurb.Bin400]|nr:MAG: putative zinc metalloprotease [bacterium ADurb.Bin400]